MYYKSATESEHIAAEYLGIPMTETGELCYYDYLVILRDAMIKNLKQTEEGRQYLEKSWYLSQDKPERGKLKETFGKGLN